MFDAVMATAGAPRRGSSKGASRAVCVSKGCAAWQAMVASDALLLVGVDPVCALCSICCVLGMLCQALGAATLHAP